MPLGRIARTHGRGNPPLRMAGVAFIRLGFGQDEHVAVPRDFGGRAERGNAASDNEKVRAKLQAAADAVILPSP